MQAIAATEKGGYLTYKPDPDDADALEKWEKEKRYRKS